MGPGLLPSFQALLRKESGSNSQRRRSIELNAADATSTGWDTGSTKHDICNYGKPDKENQISCFRAWAAEYKGQEGISLPLHSSAQLGQCLTRRHKSLIVFPFPFAKPHDLAVVRRAPSKGAMAQPGAAEPMLLLTPTLQRMSIPSPRP